jgi:hypothetical protein
VRQFPERITQDLAVDHDEFDRTLSEKLFLQKRANTKSIILGSVINRLEPAAFYQVQCGRDDFVLFFASHASWIHNEGGEITVTAKMKKYFWAMYYQANKESRPKHPWRKQE